MFCYPLMQSGSGLPGKGGSWYLTLKGKVKMPSTGLAQGRLPHDPTSPLLGQPAPKVSTKGLEISLPASSTSSTPAVPWFCSGVFYCLQSHNPPMCRMHGCPCFTPQMADHACLLTAGLLNGQHPAYVSCFLLLLLPYLCLPGLFCWPPDCLSPCTKM